MRLATLSLCAAAVVVPLLNVPVLDSPFVVPKTAALIIIAALAFLGAALRGPGLQQGVAWAALAVLATTAAAGLAAPHAPHAIPALLRWGAFFGLACGAASIDGDDRQRVLEAVAAAAALVSLIGLAQHVGIHLPIPVISAPGSTFGNRNLAAEAIALALPLTLGAAAAARVRGLRIALAAALAIELVYLAATRTRGAWIAAAVGLVVAVALARVRWSRAAAGVAIAAAVLAGAAAIIPGRLGARDAEDEKRTASAVAVARQSFDPRSIALRTRLGLWRRTLAMIGDHPVLGVGPGNWPVVFPRYAEPEAARDGVLTIAIAPRQAHDDLLERAAETGLIGLAALLALAAAAVLAIRRRLADARPHVAGAAGALAALAGAGLTGFPLEMPATLALGGLALGIAAASTRPLRWRPAAVVIAAALAVYAGREAVRSVTGSFWLGRAIRAAARDPGPDGARDALAALERARADLPGDAIVPLRAAHMSLRLGDVSQSLSFAQRSVAIEPWSPSALATLASAQLAAGDVAAARATADRALALLHDQPYALRVAEKAAIIGGDPVAGARYRDALRALTRVADAATASDARDLLGR